MANRYNHLWRRDSMRGKIQLKLRELEAVEPHVTPCAEKSIVFDISKQRRFVLAFQETEVDKYFIHFKKVTNNLA